MSDCKKVNRLYLFVMLFYVGASLFLSRILFVKLAVNLNNYQAIALSQGLVLLPGLLFFMVTRPSLPYKPLGILNILLVVLCSVFIYPLLIAINTFSLFFTKQQTGSIAEVTMSGNLGITLLLIAVLPACVEEFLFRGLFFQTYRKKNVLLGAMFSAFLFGCLHLNFNQFIYTFVFGVFLAIMVEVTGSMFSSMICHFLFNGVSVLAGWLVGQSGNGDVYLQQQSSGEYGIAMAISAGIYGLIGLCGLAGCYGIWVVLARRCHREKELEMLFSLRRKSEGRIISLPVILGIIFSFGYMIYMEFWI